MQAAAQNWQVLAPILAVATAALVVLSLKAIAGDRAGGNASDARMPGRFGLLIALFGSAALVVAGVNAYVPLLTGQVTAFDASHGIYRMDGLTAVGTLLLSVATLLTFWASSTYLIVQSIDQAEYYALLLLSLCGMLVCIGAESTPLLYIGVELMSLPLYALTAFDRRMERGQEAGIKLLISGGVASATLLYGLTLIFGATGQTDLAGIHASGGVGTRLSMIGFGLLVAGLLGKVALVPFHSVAPDTHEGAPAPFAGFLAVAPTITVLLVFIRWLGAGSSALGEQGPALFAALSIASIVVGSLMALLQDNVRRMLGYMTIVQAGIFSIAFVASTPAAFGALLFSLFAQLVIVIGFFGLLTSLASTRRRGARIQDLAGLARTNPMLAGTASLFLLAYVGFPGTIGFWSRFLLFRSAIEAGAIVPVLIAALGSALLLACALRVIIVFYTEPAPENGGVAPASNELGVMIVCAFAVLYLGFQPDVVLPGQLVSLTELLVNAVPEAMTR
jgi:NADH-quinone oxidoreductase subunit N